MNGSYVATRSVQVAQMLCTLATTYADTSAATPQGKAALAGAAAQIAAMEVPGDATAYTTAARQLLTAMTNTLDALKAQGGTA